jgi:hypothetical protein
MLWFPAKGVNSQRLISFYLPVSFVQNPPCPCCVYCYPLAYQFDLICEIVFERRRFFGLPQATTEGTENTEEEGEALMNDLGLL